MANNVYEGMTFYGETFPAGGVFVGCTFYPPCTFGEGSVFENCVFILDYYEPFHQVGMNSVFNGSVVLWTVVQPNSTIANSVVFASIVLPPSFQAGIRHREGRAIGFNHDGAITWANGRWEFKDICDWDGRICGQGAIIELDRSCSRVEWDLLKGREA